MFKRKQYIYHVVYNFQYGNGSITMYRNRKINTVEDMKSVKEYIEETTGYKNVLLTNWIRLKNGNLSNA